MINIINIIAASQTKLKSANKQISTQAEFDALIIEAGETIELLRGQTFAGALLVDVEGVTIRDYGTGNKPILTGSVDISGLSWSDEGGNIWSAPLATDPKWINISGINAKLAQTPELTMISQPASNQVEINPSDVSGYTNIVGSYFVGHDRPFSYTSRYTVIAYSAGVITLDNDISFSTDDKYHLYNDEEYLNGNNEWVWRNNTIKIQSTVNPSALDITRTEEDTGIIVNAQCSVINLDLSNYYKYGIQGNTDNLSVNSCSIHDIRGQGISVKEQYLNPSITFCNIDDIGHNGIWLGPQSNIQANYNQINNIGMGGNWGWNNDPIGTVGQTSGTAIKLNIDYNNVTDDASGVYIENNTIDNTAYNGISLGIGRTGSIKRNILSNTNMILEDGGSIYLFHYRNTDIPIDNFIIEENFISSVGAGVLTWGIYMDNRSKDNTLKNNVLNSNIYVNGDTEAQTIENNTIYSDDRCGVFFQIDAPSPTIYVNSKNIVNDNIIVVRESSISPLEFNLLDPYADGGSADRNYYINPYGTLVLYDGSDKTLSQLQSDYGQDANSTELTNYITAPGDPDNEILLITNPADSVLNGSAPAGSWKDVDGTITTNYTVQAWSSLLLLKDLT